MDRNFRDFLETPEPGVKPPKRRRGYSAFGWAVCLLLLCGIAMASWIGSFYVFSHPENPDCYQFLKKLNRIEPLKRFEVTAAPPGQFYTAKELFDNYITMSPTVLEEKNSELLRNYLRNYANMKMPVPYLCGRFTTTGVYELGKTDMFPSGMVAVANSVDCPYVQIEHIYPTAFNNVPRARQMLATEPEINLEKTFDLSTIMHVERLENGRMLFTVIPLSYGQYAYKQGISSTFRLDPPTSLNLAAGMPVVKVDALENAVKTFALYRKNRGMLAKGKILTVPPAAPLQATDLFTAQNLPPEATEPLQPAITAPHVVESAPVPENTVAASAPSPVTVPPPSVAPKVYTPPTPPLARTIAAAQTPVEPLPMVTASEATPISPADPAPVIANISLSVPEPTVTVTDTTDLSVPASAAPAKLEKSVAKASSQPVPLPAQLAKPIPASALPNPAPAPVVAASHPAPPKPKIYVAANTPPAHIPAKPVIAPTPYPIVVQRAVPVPAPAAPVQYAEAAVSPDSSPTGVKLSPFLAPQPAPIQQPQQQAVAPARTSAAWRTYRPGTMPRGKLINISSAPELADLGVGRDPVYVQGRFIVTASSDGRVVLRPVNYTGGIAGTSMRMLVEYPAGTRVPTEGTQFSRGVLRPFQITDVRRGDDGEVNVYAREVTEPTTDATPYAARYNSHYRTAQRDNAFY